MPCLDDDTVLGLVEGALAATALANVDDHLDTCESCRDVVAQVARGQSATGVLERGHAVGRYVIGELLGAGAMGRVYSAWEPELDRRVALKLLVAPGADARERVVREAQAMAKLDHPNVVGVHEVGTAAEGVYVAMDLVDGVTLRAWAETARPWRERLAVVIDIARGLAAVHAAGVVHRDIKPDNIIVGRDGRTRLGDFGLARAGGGTPAEAPPAPSAAGTLALGTPGTAVAGTPAYMAPEVLRGGRATAASDQFSFGVLVHELFAGGRPFGGTTWPALLAAIEVTRPAPLRGVPGWLDAAVRRALAPAPAARFASLAAFADEVTRRSAGRRPGRWIAGAAATTALAIAATWLAVRPAAQPAASCALGASEIAATWNAGVRARLASLGAPTAVALDRFAAAWASERDATCHAARDAAPVVTVARARCLDERRAELGALVDRLSRPGTGPRADASTVVDALAVLAAPGDCRWSTPGAASPLPLDPAAAALARHVAAQLPAMRAAIALGDARPVLATVAALVEQARASGHAPTLAEALLVDADALRATSQLAAAAIAARDAVAAAELGHDDLLVARAWLVRLAAAGERRDLALAEDTGAIAAGAIARAGSPPRLAAMLQRQQGQIAYNRGDLVAAARELAAARGALVTLSGAASLDVAQLDSALGSVARAAGDLDAAEGYHRSALAIDRSLRGPVHPDIARDLHNLAGVLRLRGALPAAAATYREALAIEETTRGATSVEAGLTHNSLGLVAMATGDWSAARAELERARDLLTAAGHGDRALALHNLGLVAAATGDSRGALASFDAAAAIYRGTIGNDAGPARRLVADRARVRRTLATPVARVPAPPGPATPMGFVPPVGSVPPPPPAAPPAGAGVYGASQPW